VDLPPLPSDAPALRRQLLAWWDINGRHAIPWKLLPDGSRPADGEAIDPYGALVAEVMLQQTQLAVVLNEDGEVLIEQHLDEGLRGGGYGNLPAASKNPKGRSPPRSCGSCAKSWRSR
jgi:hypothetical protein